MHLSKEVIASDRQELPTSLASASTEDFEASVLSQLGILYHTALGMTNHPQDAEDLLQETMLKAFRFAHTYQPGSNLRAWLFRILHTSAINRYRKQATQPIPLPDIEQIDSFLASHASKETRLSSPDPAEALLYQELSAEVQQALATLSPLSLSILLRASEEMSMQEIADDLCIPLGTVLSRLYRSRQSLQKRLGRYAASRGYRIARRRKQRHRTSTHAPRRQAIDACI